MTFATIPFGFQPPLALAVCSIKLRLDQSQQCPGHQLHLVGSQDRLLRPGPALFHAETLFVIAEAVFLPEAGAEHFEDLFGGEIQSGGYDEPRLAVSFHLEDKHVHRFGRSADVPMAAKRLVTEFSADGRTERLRPLASRRPSISRDVGERRCGDPTSVVVLGGPEPADDTAGRRTAAG